MFIIIEGIDGAGTTSLAKHLKNYLEYFGIKIFLTKEPYNEKIELEIRKELSKDKPDFVKLNNLFVADRKIHNKIIYEHLIDGYTVISDRYNLSYIGYQIATGIPKTTVWYNIKDDLHPNLLILVLVSVDIAMERIKKRDKKDYFEKDAEFLNKVQNIMISESWRYENILILNGDKPLNDVFLDLKNSPLFNRLLDENYKDVGDIYG